MAYKWLLKLEDAYPNLAKRAKEMNERDNFVMKYDPKEVETREHRERKDRERKRAKKLAKKG